MKNPGSAKGVKDHATSEDPTARVISEPEDARQLPIAKWRKPGGAQVAMWHGGLVGGSRPSGA